MSSVEPLEMSGHVYSLKEARIREALEDAWPSSITAQLLSLLTGLRTQTICNIIKWHFSSTELEIIPRRKYWDTVQQKNVAEAAKYRLRR